MIEDIECLKRIILLKSTNGSIVELARRCRIIWFGTVISLILIFVFI